MLSPEQKLRTDLIEKELMKHLRFLIESPIQNSSNAWAKENVAKIIYMNKRVQDGKIPPNEYESSIEFLEEYVRKINDAH